MGHSFKKHSDSCKRLSYLGQARLSFIMHVSGTIPDFSPPEQEARSSCLAPAHFPRMNMQRYRSRVAAKAPLHPPAAPRLGACRLAAAGGPARAFWGAAGLQA